MYRKILQAIETRADEIRNNVLEEIQRRPDTWHYQVLPDEVVSERITHTVRQITLRLGDWLRRSEPKDLMFSWFTDLGEKRCGQSMPLEDVSSVILLIRKEMSRVVRQVMAADQIFANDQLAGINYYLNLLFVRIIQSTTLGYQSEAAAIALKRSREKELSRRAFRI